MNTDRQHIELNIYKEYGKYYVYVSHTFIGSFYDLEDARKDRDEYKIKHNIRTNTDPIIDEITGNAIMDFFFTYYDNDDSTIAEYFGLPFGTVSKFITKRLDEKYSRFICN